MKFIIIFLIIIFLTSCVYIYNDITPGDKLKVSANVRINASTKVHLNDGSLIIFKEGFKVQNDSLIGEGVKYNLTRNQNIRVNGELVTNVASLEYFENRGGTSSFLLSTPAIVVGGGATAVAIFKAIFGSCPTFYSCVDEDFYLEAEGFSYSISKSFETEDLDRLDFIQTKEGMYTLKMANQALETHYINQIQLLSVEHSPDYAAFPDEKRQILLIGKKTAPVDIISKSGQNVTDLFLRPDSLWYQSDSVLLQNLTKTYTEDWLDLKFTAPQGMKQVYLSFRIRNTLLNTVLLYDVMMKSQGYKTLDWFHSKLSNLFYVWDLYKWYKKYFGLHILIFNGKSYEEITRIPDTGPLAWHDVAVKVPIINHSDVRIRIQFLPDNWMIDLIHVSFDGKYARNIEQLTCYKMTDFDDNEKTEFLDLIKENDKRYLLTFPGENYNLQFKLPNTTNGMKRTFFLNSKGYYIEWLREDWFKNKNIVSDNSNFKLNEDAIINTARLWIQKKEKFEHQFFNSKFSIK